MQYKLPRIIKDVGFDFDWDNEKVWALDVSKETMSTSELIWLLDIPYLHSEPGHFFDVTPREVIDNSSAYIMEYERTMKANTNYPIDVMFWRGRWLILDGLHRFMKLSMQNPKTVEVRKIPKSAIPLIAKVSKS